MTAHNHQYTNPRIDRPGAVADALNGEVYLDIKKLLWLGAMSLLGTVGAILTISLEAVLLFVLFTGITLCFGHSLGMHRRFIHRAYDCPKWLEILWVHLGTLVGIAGPFGMLRTHDLRDWAQRQTECHDYFSHSQAWYKDAYWQLLCSINMQQRPDIVMEPVIANDPVYQWMEKTWMWQQLPWALAFYWLGGWGFVCWGIGARIVVSNVGHWLIGYFAHNNGHRSWHVEGAAVQGHNIKWTSLLTMGECWHNNHHAFPFSAKLGLEPGQWDLGWWVLVVFEKLGLVKNLRVPTREDQREELKRLVIAP